VRQIILFCLALFLAVPLQAQFAGQNQQNRNNFGQPGSDPFGNQNQQQTDTLRSTSPPRPPFKMKTYYTSLFTLKDTTGGRKQDTLAIGRMWTASLVLPGYSQLYNRQYWKIPVVYGLMGASLYMGYQNNMKYMDTGDDRYAQNRDLFYAGALLTYWGSMLDGVVNYKSRQPVLPGRAALYSALLPGLGQAYNGDYWKIPIFCGGLMACGYMIQFNSLQYNRFKTDYNNATKPNPSYQGGLTPDNLKWYRDTYRRYRDYSIIAAVAIYALNIIDANVFAYFHDFDVSDDLSMNIRPGLIEPVNARYASLTGQSPSVGIQMQIHF
jgi:hypothetical protein